LPRDTTIHPFSHAALPDHLIAISRCVHRQDNNIA
jgi:hypothetical protein